MTKKEAILLLAFSTITTFCIGQKITSNTKQQGGKKLYSVNCASCHLASEAMVGPALKPAFKSRNKEWLNKYIWKSKALKDAGDKTALEVKKNSQVQYEHNFKGLSKNDILSIISFIEKQK